MPASDLVFGDGDRVLAMGRLVREGADWWLDSARVITLAMRATGGRSRHATKLTAADAHITALQKQDAKAAKLWLHVIGTWRRGTIAVEAVGFGPGRPDRSPAPDEVPRSDERLVHIYAALETHRDEWDLERVDADAVDGTGAPYAHVELFRVTADLASWADAQPDGLVRLDPSVRPISPR